jgi:subtilisin family serine protease
MKIKTILLVLMAVITVLPLHSEYKQAVGTNSTGGYPVAYTIYIPGEKVDNGWTAARIIKVPYLEPEDYQKNVIYVKTKTKIGIDGKTNSIYSSTLMTDLNDLGIKGVRTPFVRNEGDISLAPEPYGVDRILEIRYESDVDPYDVCRRLIENPEVEYAVPVFKRYATYTPNDPSIGKQWWINNMKLKDAWDITMGSEDIVIAIVDSGTDWKHVDLNSNIWVNPKEIPDNNIDDDGNGKIDDVRGWDFVGNISMSEIGQGRWKEDNDPRNTGTSSNNTHGTHVGGCASASTDNNKGIAGTGFKTKIMPVKCATDQNIRGIYRGYEGITYAANLGADIINCSWSGPGYSPAEQDVINNAVAKGSVVIVAAGNDASLIDNGGHFPAGYNNVVCVGATRSNNRRASFTNWGILTTVYAPGQSIYSTMPNNKYSSQSGTSMASPITAGVAALIKAVHPDWTPKQIAHQLRSTSDDVVATSPDLRPYFYGRVNAQKAVDYNRSGRPSIPGIAISNVVIGNHDALTDYDPAIIILDVTNYLSMATSVKLTVEPQNNYIGVNTNTVNVGTLNQMQTKKVSLSVELLETNPWYIGYANVIVKIEATNYVDYQLVKIPVKITSKNRYSSIGAMPEVYVPQWMGASSPTQSSVWAVGFGGLFGNNGGYMRVLGATTSGKAISNEYAYCVYAADANTAWVGTAARNGTSATVRKTTNAGSQWQAVSVSTITTFINAIHFYNDMKGVFIGDPKNGKWGIGTTNNGGQNWNYPQTVPSPLADEAGLAGCASFVGSTIWFGTNKGRIIRSTNEGRTWNATQIQGAGQIWAVAILDKNNGLAVYSDEGSEDKYIASTTNGGTTWQKNKYDFTKNKLNPVHFYTSPIAEKIYMLCSNGEIFSTESNGATWEPVLTMYHGATNIGAAVDYPTSKMRYWDIGQSIGFLDFTYIPADIVKTIELLSDTIINFDTVTVNKFRLRAATIKNTGNVPIKITPSIIPDAGVDTGEFTINAFNNDTVEPDKTLSVRVKFIPAEAGQRTAVLKINSDAEPNEITVNLVGVGKEPVSVSELEDLPSEVVIAPNPASNEFTLTGNDKPFTKIRIVDLNGNFVKSFTGLSVTKFDISDLSAGSYFIILSDGQKNYIRKLTVVR